MVLQQLERDLELHALKLKKRGRINRMEKIVKKRNFIRKKIKLLKVLEKRNLISKSFLRITEFYGYVADAFRARVLEGCS